MENSAATMLAESLGTVCLWLALIFAAFLAASAVIDQWLARWDANEPARQATKFTKAAARSHW